MSTCQPFNACLREIRAWSRAHPRHVPLFVLVETKASTPRAEPPLTTPEPITTAALDALDAEVPLGLPRARARDAGRGSRSPRQPRRRGRPPRLAHLGAGPRTGGVPARPDVRRPRLPSPAIRRCGAARSSPTRSRARDGRRLRGAQRRTGRRDRRPRPPRLPRAHTAPTQTRARRERATSAAVTRRFEAGRRLCRPTYHGLRAGALERLQREPARRRVRTLRSGERAGHVPKRRCRTSAGSLTRRHRSVVGLQQSCPILVARTSPGSSNGPGGTTIMHAQRFGALAPRSLADRLRLRRPHGRPRGGRSGSQRSARFIDGGRSAPVFRQGWPHQQATRAR